MTDLGTLVNGNISFAQSINVNTQVVGTDCSPIVCGAPAAFLWENGSIVDLNTLIPAGSPVYLQFTFNINDQGEIAATGVDANGNEHAALLIPCDANHPGVVGCDYSPVDAAVAAASGSSAPVLNRAGLVTSPQPRLTPRGMVAAWRAQMLRRYHIPASGAPRN